MLVQTTKPKYIFFADPGHAWLRVKRQELIDLSIEHRITPFSYERGEYVYLEEDSDAGTFLHAKFGKQVSFRELEALGVLADRHCNGSSAIRSYNHYNATNVY